jgi:hypothetical protein
MRACRSTRPCRRAMRRWPRGFADSTDPCRTRRTLTSARPRKVGMFLQPTRKFSTRPVWTDFCFILKFRGGMYEMENSTINIQRTQATFAIHTHTHLALPTTYLYLFWCLSLTCTLHILLPCSMVVSLLSCLDLSPTSQYAGSGGLRATCCALYIY